MKRILVLSGGGCKGLMQAVALKSIEGKTGKRICELFDLIVGSSVGAILGGILSTGKVTASDALNMMRVVIPQMFKRNIIPPFPKYKRDPFISAWNQLFNDGVIMQQAKTKFMCTSVNMCDGRTHYFKSWEEKDGRLSMLTAILRSFAAPVYFGSLVDSSEKSVWLDGGTGDSNCPILSSVIESMRQGWIKDEKAHIISIGTGTVDNRLPFDEAKKYHSIRQLLFYADPVDGGLARNQSSDTAITAAISLDKIFENFTFQHVDMCIDKKLDVIDGVKHMNEYEIFGTELSKTINYDLLIGEE